MAGFDEDLARQRMRAAEQRAEAQRLADEQARRHNEEQLAAAERSRLAAETVQRAGELVSNWCSAAASQLAVAHDPLPLVRFVLQDAPQPRRRSRVKWRVGERAHLVAHVWPLNVYWGNSVNVGNEDNPDRRGRKWCRMFLSDDAKLGFFGYRIRAFELIGSDRLQRTGKGVPYFPGGRGVMHPKVTYVERLAFHQLNATVRAGPVLSANTTDTHWVGFDSDWTVQQPRANHVDGRTYSEVGVVGVCDPNGVPQAGSEGGQTVLEPWLASAQEPREFEGMSDGFGGLPHLQSSLALAVADYLEHGPVLEVPNRYWVPDDIYELRATQGSWYLC